MWNSELLTPFTITVFEFQPGAVLAGLEMLSCESGMGLAVSGEVDGSGEGDGMDESDIRASGEGVGLVSRGEETGNDVRKGVSVGEGASLDDGITDVEGSTDGA
jgi:hypothetical protein